MFPCTRLVLPVFVMASLLAPAMQANADEPPAAARDDGEHARNAQRRRRRRRRRRPPPETPPEEGEENAEAGEATEAEAGEAGEDESAAAQLAAAAEGESGGEDGVQTTGNLRRSNRMEFDARLVRGETAGAGAVVLFNRGKRPLPPLTGERRGFSHQTVRDVIGAIDAPREETRNRRRRVRRRRGSRRN